MVSRRLLAYTLIAAGILLLATPLTILALSSTGAEISTFGIILIGPIPIILSSEDPQTAALLALALAILLLLGAVLLLRAARRAPAEGPPF